MDKIPVTVLIQTKNEEIGIGACVSAWLPFFEEVIVVDSNSDDLTSEIATQAGAGVVQFHWNGRYPKKKQWQLDNLTTAHGWILFVDADEYPTAGLIRELREFDFADLNVVAADVSLDYRFAGRVLRHGHRVTKRILVRPTRVHFPEMGDIEAPGMGELEGHYQPVADGQVVRLKGRLLHDDHDPVRTWFERHNRYSDWEAYLRATPSTKSQIARMRSRQGQVFDVAPFKPLMFFLYSYVARCGFLDGRAGFDYAFALSAYYWQIGLKTRELNRS